MPCPWFELPTSPSGRHLNIIPTDVPGGILHLHLQQLALTGQAQQGLNTPENSWSFPGLESHLLLCCVDAQLIGLAGMVCCFSLQVDRDFTPDEKDGVRVWCWWRGWRQRWKACTKSFCTQGEVLLEDEISSYAFMSWNSHTLVALSLSGLLSVWPFLFPLFKAATHAFFFLYTNEVTTVCL